MTQNSSTLVVASEDKNILSDLQLYVSCDKSAMGISFYYPELLPCPLGLLSAPQCAAALEMLNTYL